MRSRAAEPSMAYEVFLKKLKAMARFELRFKPSVAKDLRNTKDRVRRLLKRIEALRDDPRPAGCENSPAANSIESGKACIACRPVDDAAVVIDVSRLGIAARSIALLSDLALDKS